MKHDMVTKVAAVFLVCTIGSTFLQVAGPLILGIFVSSASLTVPFLLYYFLVEKKWRLKVIRPDREEEQNEDGETPEASQQEEEPEKEERSDEGQAAREWYRTEGKEKIDVIVSNLYAKGVFECWINSNGFCNIRTEKGYRRVGCLPKFLGKYSAVVAAMLKEDGMGAHMRGRYLHLFWAEE